jgi:hypothetical protein
MAQQQQLQKKKKIINNNNITVKIFQMINIVKSFAILLSNALS